jgi:hypothetical protein
MEDKPWIEERFQVITFVGPGEKEDRYQTARRLLFRNPFSFRNNKSRVGLVSLLTSPSQTMEQHVGEEFEVYPGSPVTEPMQSFTRSNWSPLIAPYRSVLIDFDSGTHRASFSATNRNIRGACHALELSGVGSRNAVPATVSCSTHFAERKRLTPNFRYGNVKIRG